VADSTSPATSPTKIPAGGLRLNLGYDRDIRDGWQNIDSAALPGVDVVVDLENTR